MKNEWNRREFLQNTSAATIAALGMSSPIASLMADPTSPLAKKAATADTVILLWMAGGMAHTETFDPKRYTPYEKGMEGNRVLSTFKSMPTAIDGVNFSEGLQSV